VRHDILGTLLQNNGQWFLFGEDVTDPRGKTRKSLTLKKSTFVTH